jgi:hypothetical protein
MDRLLLDASGGNPNQWMVIALAVLTILYIAVIRPMRKGKTKDPLQRAPMQSSLAHQRAVEREMSNLLVEYEEMIRRMTSQVDTRAAKLELLIKEADQKIAALHALPRASESEFAMLAPSESMHSPAEDSRHAEIYSLADQGRTARQIAQELNRPSGEIELILALRAPARGAGSVL